MTRSAQLLRLVEPYLTDIGEPLDLTFNKCVTYIGPADIAVVYFTHASGLPLSIPVDVSWDANVEEMADEICCAVADEIEAMQREINDRAISKLAAMVQMQGVPRT